MFRTISLVCWLTFSCTTLCCGQSTPVPFSKAVTRLEAGTIVGAENATRWNRTIMLARPRIASGDVSALSESIRQSVSKVILSIAATVDQDPKSIEPKFRLAEVGIGYSCDVKSQLKIVHSDDYQSHGVSLSFIERQMLSANERELGNLRTIARSSSLLMFDVPALLLEANTHRDYIFRHLIWIDANSGKLATMLWMLNTDKNKQTTVATAEPIRWLEPTGIEDRAIHVDGNEFTLGIPSRRAFALERLPAGRPIAWNQAAASLGAMQDYDLDSIVALMRALNEANLASKPTNK